MNNVKNSILITQFYGGGNVDGKLVIDGVTFKNITSKNTEYSMQFLCQTHTPCENIKLKDIYMTKQSGEDDSKFDMQCENAHGTADDVTPSSCLKS